jgi:carnitine O-acetyltransferase
LTAPEFESQLSYIENWCKQQPKSGPGVGALTTTDRTKWALNRKHLKSLSSRNEEILNIIENSLTVLAFDDKEPQTQIEVILFIFNNNGFSIKLFNNMIAKNLSQELMGFFCLFLNYKSLIII